MATNIGASFEIRVQKDLTGSMEKDSESKSFFGIDDMSQFLTLFEPIPEEIRKRCTSFYYSDGEDLSECKFVIDNKDNFLRQDENAIAFKRFFFPHVHFIVRYSIRGEWSNWKTVRSVGTFGFEEITVTCYETYFYRMASTKAIPPIEGGYTFTSLLKYIMSEHTNPLKEPSSYGSYKGLTFNKHSVQDIPLNVPENKKLRFSFHKERGVPDLGFLQATAFRYGFRFWIDLRETTGDNGVPKIEGIINIKPRDFWRNPEYVFLYKSEYDKANATVKIRDKDTILPFGGNILSMSDNRSGIDARAKTTFLTGYDYDPITGKVVAVTSNLPDEWKFPGNDERKKFYDGYKMARIWKGKYRSPRTVEGLFYVLNQNLRALSTEEQENIFRREVNKAIAKKNNDLRGTKNKKSIKQIQKTFEKAVNTAKTKRKNILDRIQGKMPSYYKEIIDDGKKLVLPSARNKMDYAVQLLGLTFRNMEWTNKLDLIITPNINIQRRTSGYIKGTKYYDGKWYIKTVTILIDNSGGITQTLYTVANTRFDELLDACQEFTQEYVAQTVEGKYAAALPLVQDINQLEKAQNSQFNLLRKTKETGIAKTLVESGSVMPVPEGVSKQDYTFTQTPSGNTVTLHVVGVNGNTFPPEKYEYQSAEYSNRIKELRKNGFYTPSKSVTTTKKSRGRSRSKTQKTIRKK